MKRFLLIIYFAAGCSSPPAEVDGGADASAIVDGPAPDLNPCPSYYVNSGVCPKPGLVCNYFEAVCYCDSNAGMWFCCGKNAQAMCPPPSTPPFVNGAMCDESYLHACSFDCKNGITTTCACMGCRWQCTTSACGTDGGTDGG
jgi:hypothetical protein